VHVRELVAAFVRRGHSVVVAAPRATKSPHETRAALAAPLLEIPPTTDAAAAVAELNAFAHSLAASPTLAAELRRILYNPHLVRELRRRFGGDPPDLVYERASVYSTAGAEIAAALDVPLIVELNAPLAVEQAAYRGNELRELAIAAERATLTRADAVLAVSEALREYVVSLGADAERVHVVPNGVDARTFRPDERDAELRAALGLNGGPVLGFVGGLRPWHGLEFLPPLLERLVRRHADVRLVVVGDGPLRAELECDLRARGVDANATFTGALPHDDVPPLIRQFDAALAPYPEANGHSFYFSPLKLFEYMACGVPVVGARVGQLADVVGDGETGLLYAPGDVDGLAAACERLLGDPVLGKRLGAAAAQKVRTEYTWDGNAARVEQVAGALTASRRIAA
jgi:glycosyltransferase involved in cell wall biosynthesis